MQKVEQRHIDSAREYYSGAFLCEAVLAEQFARFEASLSGGWEDAIEAAAKVLDERAELAQNLVPHDLQQFNALSQAATAIRALTAPPASAETV